MKAMPEVSGEKEIIRCEDIWKVHRLGKVEIPALRGLNISVERGEFLAVVGPSGSGKSTLLHILGTLDRPTKGRVIIDGIEPSGMSDSLLSLLRNRRIGFVFQAFNLISRLRAVENIEVPLMQMGVAKEERRKRALHALGEVGLAHRVMNRPTELSGGEQQRVAMARALVTEPSIILCDEPTGNLDSHSTEGIVSLMKEVNGSHGTTIVVVTHNPLVASATDRIVRLKDGAVEKEERLR